MSKMRICRYCDSSHLVTSYDHKNVVVKCNDCNHKYTEAPCSFNKYSEIVCATCGCAMSVDTTHIDLFMECVKYCANCSSSFKVFWTKPFELKDQYWEALCNYAQNKNKIVELIDELISKGQELKSYIGRRIKDHIDELNSNIGYIVGIIQPSSRCSIRENFDNLNRDMPDLIPTLKEVNDVMWHIGNTDTEDEVLQELCNDVDNCIDEISNNLDLDLESQSQSQDSYDLFDTSDDLSEYDKDRLIGSNDRPLSKKHYSNAYDDDEYYRYAHYHYHYKKPEPNFYADVKIIDLE